MEVENGVCYHEKFNLSPVGMGTEKLEVLESPDLELVQTAFQELRNKLPCSELENLTELEVLQLALEYIYGLQRILLEKENFSPDGTA